MGGGEGGREKEAYRTLLLTSMCGFLYPNSDPFGNGLHSRLICLNFSNPFILLIENQQSVTCLHIYRRCKN